MRARTRILTPLAASVLLLGVAACGQSGSSGTGGSAASGSSSAAASGAGGSEDCAPVAGDQLVVLEDDKHLQNADNIIPAVNADAADDALLVAVLALLTEALLVVLSAALTPGPRRWSLPRPSRRQAGGPQPSAVPL